MITIITIIVRAHAQVRIHLCAHLCVCAGACTPPPHNNQYRIVVFRLERPTAHDTNSPPLPQHSPAYVIDAITHVCVRYDVISI